MPRAPARNQSVEPRCGVLYWSALCVSAATDAGNGRAVNVTCVRLGSSSARPAAYVKSAVRVPVRGYAVGLDP